MRSAVERRRRRWVRYQASGEPARRRAQPLYWGLGYLAACVIVQTAAGFYWLTRGGGWFDSAAGQQAPVLLGLLVLVALVGLARVKSR